MHAQRDLDRQEREGLELRRQANNIIERRIELEGRSAVLKRAEAARRAQEQAASALQSIQTLQLRLNAEAIQSSGATLADKISFLRVELAERKRVIGESIADEQERLTAIATAEQAFSAKRRALRRAASQERQARRAQETAADMAAERLRFKDLQRLAEAQVRLDGEGFEQQRQLIELRFQTSLQMAQNEIQVQIAVLNKRRELQALEEKQEADRRRAELILKGYQARIQPVDMDNGDTWHRVMIGPYDNINTLHRAQDKLAANGVETLPIQLKD